MPDENQTLGNIEPIEIQEEMERSFLDYAMSVITARALPDARDGLKPVQRRILYGMYDEGMRPDRPHRKCANAVGEVMGKYHPHGDQSIYDALARHGTGLLAALPADRRARKLRLARTTVPRRRATPKRACRSSQWSWSVRSTRTPSTSARRTTVATASRCVLPARFPNLLVNGGGGIAVGMATNIPPHNLSEVIDATVHLIDNPEATVDDLMHFVTVPTSRPAR